LRRREPRRDLASRLLEKNLKGEGPAEKTVTARLEGKVRQVKIRRHTVRESGDRMGLH